MREKGKKYIKYLHKKGFTLAELLIVVAIIAVLVAVSIPIFTGRLEKARLAANEANIRSAKAAAIADWMDTAKRDGEEIDEDLLAKLREMIAYDLIIYAYEGGGGDTSGGSSGEVLYSTPNANTRRYGYNVEANGLYNPGSATSVTSSGVYTRILVDINIQTADITTYPHIANGKVVASFGTNDFDSSTSGGQQSGGSGTHGGG